MSEELNTELSGFATLMFSFCAASKIHFICVMQLPKMMYLNSSNSSFEYPPWSCIIFICLKTVDLPDSPVPVTRVSIYN